MRKLTGIVAVAILLAAVVGRADETKPAATQAKPTAAEPKPATAEAKPTVELKKAHFANQQDQVAYAIGIDIGNSIKKQGLELNSELIAKGLHDAMAGDQRLLSDQEVVATLAAFQAEMRAKMQDKMKAVSEKNKRDGEMFLAENKKKDGITVLPSGLQYKVLTAGKGAKPTANDSVSVNYRGTLIDGTEFDSSFSRGTPATFKVNAVIPGWTEALQLMPVGSKWQLFIPSSLAYGERQAGPKITPSSTLIFEVELLSIGDAKPVEQKPVEQKPAPKTP